MNIENKYNLKQMVFKWVSQKFKEEKCYLNRLNSTIEIDWSSVDIVHSDPVYFDWSHLKTVSFEVENVTLSNPRDLYVSRQYQPKFKVDRRTKIELQHGYRFPEGHLIALKEPQCYIDRAISPSLPIVLKKKKIIDKKMEFENEKEILLSLPPHTDTIVSTEVRENLFRSRFLVNTKVSGVLKVVVRGNNSCLINRFEESIVEIFNLCLPSRKIADYQNDIFTYTLCENAVLLSTLGSCEYVFFSDIRHLPEYPVKKHH